MYALVADQIFGLNGLVNFSNIVFLTAYSVRNVLWLRILAIAGEGMTLPYYYYQDEKLWPPIYWGAAFMIVNAVRVVSIALERRPVVLSDKEEELYRVAFSSVDKREFLRLVNLAQWLDCSPGEVILKKGQQVSDAVVLVSGKLEAVLGNRTRMALRPGQLIGDVSVYSGLASPVDVMACGPAALVKWDLQHLREFTASRARTARQFSADRERRPRGKIARYDGCRGEKIAAEPWFGPVTTSVSSSQVRRRHRKGFRTSLGHSRAPGRPVTIARVAPGG